MTIQTLREIAATSGIAHAEYCLEQYTSQVGRDAADALWFEMAAIVVDHADANDGLDA